ncbi:putative uncharacterized protein [Prevotella sp. CAG:924]|nr:putative uncharacterized protein [Prevotella sp. CAG:924]
MRPKILALLFLLLCCPMVTRAQVDNQKRAEQIYQYLIAGQGDSIYAALNDEAQSQLSPALFNDFHRQLEAQYGALQSTSSWRQQETQGIMFYYRDMTFGTTALRLLLAFDADGRMNTIRLIPAPVQADSSTVALDSTKAVERDIIVETGTFRLPGTLTLPRVEKGRKVPCVILVHGSGPNDRDETIGPNKPFRDLAWLLAQRGIAVIRYDKRTKVYGNNSVPKGRKLDMDTETCDDALSAVRLAATLPEIARDSIFVLGHSQGGMMAPRIAQRSKDVAGIIILAGLARRFEDAIMQQSEYIASLTGTVSPQVRAQLDELQRQVANVKQLGTTAFNDSIPLPLGLPKEYWEFLRTYDAAKTASALSCPILVLQGGRDYQVTMDDHRLWTMTLAIKPHAQLKVYPKLNHILQEGDGKSTPTEYNEARPVPAYVAEDIAGFIRGNDIR